MLREKFMNIVKVINHGLVLLFLLLSFNVAAEQAPPSRIVELPSLSMKLSNDGTGIVKLTCSTCDFKFLKITRDSKAMRNGAEVSIQEARQRAGKRVALSYNPQTHEVQFIHWYDKKPSK